MTTSGLNKVSVDGLDLAYREAGTGPAVLLVHGWPTSSFLWRNVMPAIAEEHRVLALDLPGYGGSDKPVDAHYGFEYFERAIVGFLDAVGVERAGVAAHDLGGPVATHLALERPDRVSSLALLNTLVYPEFSEMVFQFLNALSNPEARAQLTSPQGLEAAMRLGLADQANLTDEVLDGVVAPFSTDDDRLALAKAGIELEPEGFESIGARLGSLAMPLRVIYGERDAILPDIAETVARIRADLPETEVTSLPDCGHFLQEEEPERIGELLARYFTF